MELTTIRKRPTGLLFIAIIVACGCSKSKDAAFSSVAGTWAYVTPDQKIDVTFELANGAGGLELKNQVMKLEGTDVVSAAAMSGVSLPSIQRIRINANDTHAVFPYNIDFRKGNVSSDFTVIKFDSVSYTWPYTTTHFLTDVSVKRK